MPENNLNLISPKVPLPKTTGPSSRKTLAFFIGLLVLVFAALVIGRSGNQTNTEDKRTLEPYHQGFLFRVKNFFFNSEAVLEGQDTDRINILLLGIGGVGHDGPYLSDTNIILSIKPSTKEVAFIPVPRDLAVEIPGHGWRRINSANAFGEANSPGSGGDFARVVFEKNLGLSIPYYVRVDFKAFENLINIVGGIEVNVPRSFTDTQYPGPNYSYQTVAFAEGKQVMNGEQALIYARSRHGNNGEGSDFARGRRQELILTALRERTLSAGTLLNPARLQNIYQSLQENVNTNLTFEQLIFLGGVASELKLPAKNVVLDSAPGGFLVNTTGENGAFMLSPKSGNFDDIKAAIAGVFESASPAAPLASEPQVLPSATYITIPNANTTSTKVEVQNGTWRAGLAARVGDDLGSKGFTVIRVGNSLKRPIERTMIYALHKRVSEQVLKKLSSELKAPYATVIPEWLVETYDNPETGENEQGMKYNTGADILIILGADTQD